MEITIIVFLLDQGLDRLLNYKEKNILSKKLLRPMKKGKKLKV